MPNTRILSHAIAQQFLKDPQSVALNECDVLEDHAAAILASSREDLCLDGLKAISAAAAQALIPHTGAISLQSLEELTLSTAQFVSQHVGPLRELNLGAFIDEPFVFAALRRHPSLVAQVVQDDLMARILKTKDIDKEDEYEFEFADANSSDLCDEEYYGNPMDDGLQLLARAEGRPVWSVSLASVKDSWVCENAGAYTLYFIGDRDEVLARLRSLQPRLLTAEIARRLLEDAVADFSDYGDIDVEAARVLGKNFDWASGETLDLSGLCSLSPEVAEALAQPMPQDRDPDTIPMLCLRGLDSLPDDAAVALGRRWWSLGIRTPTLTPKGAAGLSRIHSLGLEGLPEITEGVAAELGKPECFIGAELGITTRHISEPAARLLARVGGGLTIEGICDFDTATVAALATHVGELCLNDLAQLSVESARELANHQGPLKLWGLQKLDEYAADELIKHGGSLSLDPSRFSARVGTILKQHPSLADSK